MIQGERDRHRDVERRAARTTSREVIDNVIVFPHSKNGRSMSLEGVGRLDSMGEPDVDEDGVNTSGNCNGRASVVLGVFGAL